MYDNEYFVVDMASCSSTGEIINSLSLALETLNHSGKKIVLKLNDSKLNQSQMLSIQSLITSYGCILDTVETINEDTVRIAENMNILVQKPIEKRIEDKYSSDAGFKPFKMGSEEDDKIALKDVVGLHFEADLDAIQKQQDNIDINSDLQKAGISPNEDFNEIEEKIATHYLKKDIELTQTENFKNIEKPISEVLNTTVETATLVQEEKKVELFDHEATEEKPLETEVKADEFEEYSKNSIGVYKKAYDETQVPQDEWEEVDFYETPTSEPIVTDSKNTTYINQTLRSGQILESEGNVVIIGDCHPGSEIRAVGDITVWGVLSGIAHAGCKGNTSSKVRALKLNAVQLRIANCYSRRPDTTNIPYIIRSSIFTPEEARIVDNEIMLFKINQN